MEKVTKQVSPSGRCTVISNRTFENFIKITLLPFVFTLFLMLPGHAAADDTEIYFAGASLRPMVLVILDNSGSMGNPISSSANPYDYTIEYGGSRDSTTWYRYTFTETCTRWDWRGRCTRTSRTYTWQVYSGATPTDANHDGIADSNSNIRIGNRLNYEDYTTRDKMEIAQDVLKTIVSSMSDQVDFGLMTFNYEDGGRLRSTVGADENTLHTTIDSINAETWTPLAEALTDGAKYYQGTYRYYSSGVPSGSPVASPWTSVNWCQKAYVIIITDGAPTHDTDKDIIGYFLNNDANGNPQAGITDSNRGQRWDKTVPADYSTATGNDVWVRDDYYSEGTPQTFLDDVAKYLYSHDLRPDIEGNQNITTYTIGFAIDHPLLSQTATEGGGQYYTATNVRELENSITQALSDITAKFQTYTAPVVPVTRTSSGDKMYLAFFKPVANQGFWPGDIQKYGLSSSNQITDLNGIEATNADGSMKESAIPYWSANSVLRTRTSARSIYTKLGSSDDLTDSSNAFTIGNSALINELGTPTKLNGGRSGYSAEYDLIRYLHGFDAYNENGSGYDAKRNNILGDILHSVPLVVDYDSAGTPANRYIFFGSNDGMIHCINDENGTEVWAFIPPDQLARLKYIVEDTAHKLFMDSSIKLYQERNQATGAITKAIIIFGERAGGGNYYALDVTTPSSPKYLWRINSLTSGYGELGQTWSEPVIGTVSMNDISGNPQDYKAIIFGAGFDDAQANNEAVAASAKGRGVFITDVFTGALLKSFVYTSTNGMNFAIPSSVLAVDQSFDGRIDRIYVGDLGGNLWRIGAEDGKDNLINNWNLRKLFSSGGGRKIFYPPDIAFLNGYDYLYFGTGDRDNPRQITTPVAVNRIYGVKDTNPDDASFVTLTESSLTDQTSTVFSTVCLNSSGWYVRLTSTGEAALAPCVLFNGYVLTTTFIPNSAICSVGGDSRLYASYYLNGASTFYNIGTGIPTEVVLVVRASGTTGFIGAGAGVKNVRDLTPAPGSINQTPISDIFDVALGIIPISWREVFNDE